MTAVIDLEMVDARKKMANELMTKGSFVEALTLYTAILQEIDDDSSGTDHGDAVVSIQLSCLNNAAMAYLKLASYQDCINTCTKALEIDVSNLKAYYRRSLSYMELAKSEDESKIYPKNGEWSPSQYWDQADDDANSILERESENRQGKNLKADIRKSKLDLETKLKYNMKAATMSDDTKNSVFKGFPREVPSVSEDDIAKHIQRQQKEERERAAISNLEQFQKQQAENYSKSSGYVFLDPNWTPELASSTGDSAGPGGGRTDVKAIPSSEGKSPSKGGTKKVSFKEILRKTRDGRSDTKKIASRAAGGADNPKKLVETEAVKGALKDLKSTEDQAKERVLNTYTMKDAIGSTRAKGSEKVKERLGFKDTEKTPKCNSQSELKEAGECGGVWAELEMEEKLAINRVKKLVHDRNQL